MSFNPAVANSNWYVVWVPQGFGSSSARVIDIFDTVKGFDPEAELFSPVYEDVQNGKSKWVSLFGNYAFVKCQWSSWIEERVRDSSKIYISFLKVPGTTTPYPLTDEEMETLKGSLEEQVVKIKQKVHTNDLAVGDYVRLTKYNLMGKILYFLPPSRAKIETTTTNERPYELVVRVTDLEKV